MHPGTGLCQPIEQECAANQTKNPTTGNCENACPSGMVADADGLCKPSTDDCPAGNVRAPSGECLPGEGQCAAGEARRPNGTCGRDSDGDGQADEDDEDPENDPDRETASGGDTCSAPPSCSGGPIDCLQAKIQWRIDCNTRHKVNVTGGACGAMPVCVGENCKAMEYAQLLQQWKAACALEKLANADGGGEGGDNSDLIALLTGPGSINGEHGDTGGMPGGDGPFQWGEGEEHEPDTAGFGYGSSCPSPPSFTVGGRTISIDLTIMCQWVSLAGSIVLILAGLASVRIVSGGIA
ncbi:virulence factor TspB C-terminal domain-related protein [Pseudoxanthomonas mexicana]